MKYYKVVNVDLGQYYSYAVYSKFRITYKVNEWVEPKIGKIFIFKTIQDAFNFLSNEGHVLCDNTILNNFAIFECEAEDVEELLKMGYPDTMSIQNCWDFGIREKDTPKGTLSASKIKLTKKVM